MNSVRQKIALQFLVSNLAIVANFALVVILSRLLSPTDIGIFSMSAVLIAVAHVFRDFGVTTYLKREKELSHDTIRSATGLLTASSWSVAALMYASAGWWAAFFSEPRVAEVVRVLAIGFVFIPFGAIPSAILTRNLAVGKSAQVTALSTAVYFATSILLAWQGFGHMTMAWANLVNIVVSGLAYHWVLEERIPWMPSMRGWRRILHFGTGNLLTALLKAADGVLPDIVLGRLGTPAAVGLFSRANSTVNMVGTALNPTINYFALPYLAKVHHTQGRLSHEYLHASAILYAILLPSLAFIALTAHDIVLLLYGPQWLGSVAAIPWLCLAYGLSSLFTLTTPALAGIGKPYAGILPLSLALAAKLLCVALVFDGSLQTFAMAMALGQLASTPVYLHINRLHLQVRLGDWLLSLGKTATMVAVPGCVAWLALRGLGPAWPPLHRLGIGALSFTAAYLACVGAIPSPARDELSKLMRARIRTP